MTVAGTRIAWCQEPNAGVAVVDVMGRWRARIVVEELDHVQNASLVKQADVHDQRQVCDE